MDVYKDYGDLKSIAGFGRKTVQGLKERMKTLRILQGLKNIGLEDTV